MSDQTNPSSSWTPPVSTATRHAISAHGLNPAQNAALTVIVAGGGMIAAANAAKVHRGTLYRWMQKDAAFQRALEGEQDRALCAARRQLMTFVEDCASNVRNAVRCGDVRVSLSVLRGLGLLRKIESCESVVSAEEAEAEAKPEY